MEAFRRVRLGTAMPTALVVPDETKESSFASVEVFVVLGCERLPVRCGHWRPFLELHLVRRRINLRGHV